MKRGVQRYQGGVQEISGSMFADDEEDFRRGRKDNRRDVRDLRRAREQQRNQGYDMRDNNHYASRW